MKSNNSKPTTRPDLQSWSTRLRVTLTDASLARATIKFVISCRHIQHIQIARSGFKINSFFFSFYVYLRLCTVIKTGIKEKVSATVTFRVVFAIIHEPLYRDTKPIYKVSSALICHRQCGLRRLQGCIIQVQNTCSRQFITKM